MDTPTLPLGSFEQGGRYLTALDKLGLRPDAFFWAFDHVTDGFVLILVSEAFDSVGPFDLSRLLFKAFNAEATPKSIDPFMIRLHSPHHRFVRDIEPTVSQRGFGPGGSDGRYEGKTSSRTMRALTCVDGLAIDSDWVYRFDRPKAETTTSDVLRQWHRFQRNVDRYAA